MSYDNGKEDTMTENEVRLLIREELERHDAFRKAATALEAFSFQNSLLSLDVELAKARDKREANR